MDIEITKIPVSHEDDRRTLTAIFNGDFTSKQVKILHSKTRAILGGHYHNYPELFYVLKGSFSFSLEIDNETQNGILTEGYRLVIPPHVKHTMLFEPDTITIEATTEPYLSPEENDK